MLGALALLALAGASGCVPVFDYPLGDLNPPSADAASDTSVESSDGAAEAQADASVDASGDVDASVDADASDASTDAVADVTSDDVTADAIADVTTDAESGATSPGVGALGAACATTGDLACAGHAVKQQLVCGADLHWQGNGACSSGTLCDSRAGANQGTCATIDALCAASTPGAIVCTGQTPTRCGPDLVSSETLAPCAAQACTASGCVGVCVPGQKRCDGAIPQACDATGTWAGSTPCGGNQICTGTACASCGVGQAACANVCVDTATDPNRCGGCGVACLGTQTCVASHCIDVATATGTSCRVSADGLTNCGDGGSGAESCCTSLLVAGGDFYRSYDGVPAPQPYEYTSKAYPATVSAFRLDKYEVTVGRFRQFIAAWDGGWRPAQGAGKHSHLNGGQGLAATGGGFETGWDTTWSAALPTTNAVWSDSTHLPSGNSTFTTWTSSPAVNERRPLDNINWFEAYAFCIWDGGVLPSEAEWNYAAAGGSEQRVYPWSSPPTSAAVSCSFASYAETTACNDAGPTNVGLQSPLGNGRWGQADLAGNVKEWLVDDYPSPNGPTDGYTATCVDCAHLLPDPYTRSVRGGSFWGSLVSLHVSYRDWYPAANRDTYSGARCARSP